MRETSLWFFEDNDDGANANARAGILTDGRPAEFWALEDLARGEAGVRVRTATGRTCSVVLMRRSSTGERGDGDEDEEEEGEETEFQMIDGKERERILDWVRRHRSAFGAAKKIHDAAQALAPSRGAAAIGKEKETGREDSDSDSDFEASGESDGGSPSSSGSGSGSDVGSDAGTGEKDEDESRSEGGNESGSDEGDMSMELDDDPKHHPLLRAGALPKMSRAAMDAAVELVVGDLVVGQGQGKARRDAPSAVSSSRPGHLSATGDGREGGAVAGAGDDDEEDDELED